MSARSTASDRRAPRQLCRAGRRAGRHDAVPQDRGARRQPVRGAALQPLRRARRPDVARRRVHPVGARVPGRRRRPSRSPRWLLLASPLRLARQGRVHARARARADRCDGAEGARADRRIPRRPDRRGADRARLPDRRRARPGIHRRAAIASPNHAHLLPGGIALFKARQRISEILRIVPGSSLVVAPSDSDLADPELAAGLEECFGGGGYTATQRSALLQLAWDHVVLGARRPRVGVRAARQRRHAGLARPAAPQLRRLQRAGQRGAERDRHRRCRRSTSASIAAPQRRRSAPTPPDQPRPPPPPERC